MKGNKWYGSIGRLIIFVIFCLFAIVIILPMIWMLVSSFKSNTEFLADPLGLPSVCNNRFGFFDSVYQCFGILHFEQISI